MAERVGVQQTKVGNAPDRIQTPDRRPCWLCDTQTASAVAGKFSLPETAPRELGTSGAEHKMHLKKHIISRKIYVMPNSVTHMRYLAPSFRKTEWPDSYVTSIKKRYVHPKKMNRKHIQYYIWTGVSRETLWKYRERRLRCI